MVLRLIWHLVALTAGPQKTASPLRLAQAKASDQQFVQLSAQNPPMLARVFSAALSAIFPSDRLPFHWPRSGLYFFLLLADRRNWAKETSSAAALLCFLATDSTISPFLKLGMTEAGRISATRMSKEQSNQPFRNVISSIPSNGSLTSFTADFKVPANVSTVRNSNLRSVSSADKMPSVSPKPIKTFEILNGTADFIICAVLVQQQELSHAGFVKSRPVQPAPSSCRNRRPSASLLLSPLASPGKPKVGSVLI
jgi:hypothetical protein